MGIIAGFMVPHPPIIMSEVGRGEERKIAKTVEAYETVGREIAKLAPDTVVITTPHSVCYSDYFHISPGAGASGDMGDFRAPQVTFDERYDTQLVNRLSTIAQREGFPAGTLGEREKALDHGTMVPLYFIEKYLLDFSLVRIGLSGLSLEVHYRFGELIAEAAESLDRRVVFVASGDLSHKMLAEGPYGYAPEGPEYDDKIMRVMGSGNFDSLFTFSERLLDRSSECGHRSFVIMAGAFDGVKVRARSLSHEATFGVGYGICTFYPRGRDEKRRFRSIRMDAKQKVVKEQHKKQDVWVQIAREALETYILSMERIRPNAVDFSEFEEELFLDRAGTFVSLHKDGRLRGCIGTFLPTCDCVADELVQNAISAGTADPRFSPVTADELAYLEYSVDVLSSPEPVADVSELDEKTYGVIVTSGLKRGLLLPDLEGVDSVEEQIAIAMQKAGIHDGEPISLQRFKVIRHR